MGYNNVEMTPSSTKGSSMVTHDLYVCINAHDTPMLNLVNLSSLPSPIKIFLSSKDIFCMGTPACSTNLDMDYNFTINN